MQASQQTEGPQRHFLDVDNALDLIGDHEQLLIMLDMAIDSLARDMAQVRTSLTEGDGHKAQKVLHSLKGFLQIFTTQSLSEHVIAVELLSKTQSVQEVTAAFDKLEPELISLLEEMKAYVRDSQAPVI